MSSEKRLFAFIFLVLPNLLSYIIAQEPIRSRSFCSNENDNYTANSTYQTNLNTLLSSMSTNINQTGFYSASIGQSPDRANAIVLCRADIQLDDCRRCVQDATTDLVNSCPNQRQAFLCGEYCMLRFSNESIVGTMTNSPELSIPNPQNASSVGQFMTDLRTLLDRLRDRAASGGSLLKVATGDIKAPDFQTIFALVQCTPDLTSNDCNNCLMEATANLPSCCRSRMGARVLAPSCNLRYETYIFYDETRLRELEQILLPPPPPPSPGSNDNNTTRTIIIIVVSIVVGLIIAIFIGLLLRKRIRRKPMEEFQMINADDISFVESLQYEFEKIKDATNDFSNDNKLGEGGFGAVFKGKLLNGQEIAVKRLSNNSGQGSLEFKNEVTLLARLQHRNLVRLMGFSIEGTEKLLVYEFVQNASLDHFIYDPTKRSYLNWDRRYKIICGIARGLLYLHEDSRHRIIHRDLKASNVLLDVELNPKIADFGMAKLFVPDETQGNTSRIVGTYGYMSPEYAIHGQFSVKSDVFSFGVLFLEIISGKKYNYFRNGENAENLISTAWRNWRAKTTVNFIDPVLSSTSGTPCDILRCIHIGLLCVQENAVDRPTMASVVLMLNSFSITMPVPSQPGFYTPRSNEIEVSLRHELNSSELDSSKSRRRERDNFEHISQNDVSITELCPR